MKMSPVTSQGQSDQVSSVASILEGISSMDEKLHLHDSSVSHLLIAWSLGWDFNVDLEN